MPRSKIFSRTLFVFFSVLSITLLLSVPTVLAQRSLLVDEKPATLQIPEAPSNLTLQPSDFNRSLVLNWTDNSLDEIGFIIERSLDYYGEQWFEIARVSAGVTTFTDTKIAKPDWNFYQYRVKAYNESGVSKSSNEEMRAVMPSGKLYGYARAVNGNVHANVVIALKPKHYGYGTKDYVTNADNTGYFEFTDVLRKVSSSGGQPYWIEYTLYIDGNPASPEFMLKDPFVLRQDAVYGNY